MGCCKTTYWCKDSNIIAVEADADGVYATPEGASGGPYPDLETAEAQCTAPTDPIALQCCDPDELPGEFPGQWLVEWDTEYGVQSWNYPTISPTWQTLAFGAYAPALSDGTTLTRQSATPNGHTTPHMWFPIPITMTGDGFSGGVSDEMNALMATKPAALVAGYSCNAGRVLMSLSQDSDGFSCLGSSGTSWHSRLYPAPPPSPYQIYYGLIYHDFGAWGKVLQECADHGGPSLWTPPTLPGGELGSAESPTFPEEDGWYKLHLSFTSFGQVNETTTVLCWSDSAIFNGGYLFGCTVRFKLHAL